MRLPRPRTPQSFQRPPERTTASFSAAWPSLSRRADADGPESGTHSAVSAAGGRGQAALVALPAKSTSALPSACSATWASPVRGSYLATLAQSRHASARTRKPPGWPPADLFGNGHLLVFGQPGEKREEPGQSRIGDDQITFDATQRPPPVAGHPRNLLVCPGARRGAPVVKCGVTGHDSLLGMSGSSPLGIGLITECGNG